nr:YjcZ family sporulation protein [Thalassobacillus sp. C254]
MWGHGGCYDPCGYGYPTQVAGVGHGPGRGFALIVVLFILLIIVGASRFHHHTPSK